MSEIKKIGMYSTDEILEFMTEGEGRGFLGRSMFDTMYFEIERLTELCNKYEEEHKTTFETWQKDIKENERLHSIIKELEKYINEEYIYDELGMKIFDASELQDKLQELKRIDKENN